MSFDLQTGLAVQPSQPHPQPPVFLVFQTRRAARPRARTITAIRIISTLFILQIPPMIRIPMARTINATTQATTHCQITTLTAHLYPISRRMEAMAATQGV